jgi:uncharacterized protein (TIGR02117 family)
MRRIWYAPLAALAALALYGLAAVVLGLVPVNADFRPEQDGVPVFLRSNGTHVDIVLPTRTRQWDFAVEFGPADFPRLGQALPWIAFGWGDREFLLQTPTWADVRPGVALRAVLGLGEGAVHVEYIDEPGDFAVIGTRLSSAQYLALVTGLRGQFGRDTQGRVQRIAHAGYGVTDAFYVGTGRYLPWITCNEWVRRLIARAGVRTAVWAPFEPALLFHARRVASD